MHFFSIRLSPPSQLSDTGNLSFRRKSPENMSAATWILCSKVFLISTGAISIAMAIKFSVPSIMAFAYYDVPTVWTTLVSWLKPPYLYFIVNGIIITIVASSRFSHKAENLEHNQTQPLVSATTPQSVHIAAATIPVQPLPVINVVQAPPEVAYEAEDERESKIMELKPVVVNGIIEEVEDDAYGHVLDEDDDDLATSKSAFSPPEADDMEIDDGEILVSKSACTSPQKIISPAAQLDYFLLPVEKKPPLPSRFSHPKPVKVIPEGGRAVRIARQKKKHETLESTWKMIMESRERQLKKSDTFENHGCHLDVNVQGDNDLLQQHVLKSGTFKDRTNYDDAPPAKAVQALGWSTNLGKIKKELSLGQDELNRRVEAFIKKFNEDMRLQRQESIDQYMEMINRGGN